MLFNSYIFIFGFLPITLILFFQLKSFTNIRLPIVWLTIASFIFYAYWLPQYVVLLAGSILINFYLGCKISSFRSLNPKKAKIFLGVGIFGNLCFIGYFKYANFLIQTISNLLPYHFGFLEIILPLGISFYTFTQIAYLIDIYIEDFPSTRYSLLDYTCFVIFFPQLIAGPILRHNELIPQLQKKSTFQVSYHNLAIGLIYFVIGLAKKILIADLLASWVSPIFSDVNNVTLIEAWIGVLSYTFQLYFDFSGYSDMAIGLGLLFNIKLPINFNSPYKANAIGEFWRRWHITLSNFLRDYLYIPLGGNRKGELRLYLNLIIVMLLGGLWHGAGWTFVIWGLLHGIYLCTERIWRKYGFPIPIILGWLINFIAIVLSWVIFRANTLRDGFTLWQALFGMTEIRFSNLYHLSNPEFQAATLLLVFLIVLLTPNSQEIVSRYTPSIPWFIGTSGIFIYILLSLNKVSEFLYFQF